MPNLFKSRKFMTAIVDLVASVILYFVGKYAVPAIAEDVVFMIGVMQPVFLLVIAGIAYEDGQAKASGMFKPWAE